MSVSTGKAKLWLCRWCSEERQPLLTGLSYDLQISLVEGQHAQIVGDLSQPRGFRTFNAGQNMSVLLVVPFRTTLIPIANTKKVVFSPCPRARRARCFWSTQIFGRIQRRFVLFGIRRNQPLSLISDNFLASPTTFAGLSKGIPSLLGPWKS